MSGEFECEHPPKAVFWNPFNSAWQCHRCGETISVSVPPKGLYGKYIVYKTDDRKWVDGDVFVLRPDRDPHAIKAIRAYADAVRGSNSQLADDLDSWMDDVERGGA